MILHHQPQPINVIGFSRAGHHHIIAWSNEHHQEEATLMGTKMHVPEFDIDPLEAFSLIRRMREIRNENNYG